MCEETQTLSVAVAATTVAATAVPDDVAANNGARAREVGVLPADEPKATDSGEAPPKKRKTRRGKSKRRHPYRAAAASAKMAKAEAPYNSNRFLIEDHGDLDCIDEELKKTDQASTSTVTRTRDSSFSMDSDGEFYSTPDDEDVYFIKDFDNQYESLQAERLQAMSKDELIKEYLMLEGKVELLSQRLRAKTSNVEGGGSGRGEAQKEIQRLMLENESLKRDNEHLRAKIDSSSDSADSETDSSDTCSSSSTGGSRGDDVVVNGDAETNGHCANVEQIIHTWD